MDYIELIWLCYDYGVFTVEIAEALDALDFDTFGSANDLFEDLCHDVYVEHEESLGGLD